ncbi:MAG: phosphotransferase [Leptolyngbya sp.]|nr:phosphotransferase [Candidatus Melainabacteria bacterium]
MKNENSRVNLQLIVFPEVSEIEKFITRSIGKKVQVTHINVLRHRDFSFVARVFIHPHFRSLVGFDTLIYKKVKAPWDCEANIALYVKNSGLPHTARLIEISKAPITAQFLQEDLGELSLMIRNSHKLALETGRRLAEIHLMAKSATAELPEKLERFDSAKSIVELAADCYYKLHEHFADFDRLLALQMVGCAVRDAQKLTEGDMCFQHGDVYAENIMLRQTSLAPTFIDWSYFCFVGPQLYDLATLTSAHSKNRALFKRRDAVIQGYCDVAQMPVEAVKEMLPAAFRFSRLMFLKWLLVRVDMGITQTTVGPVRPLIDRVVQEIIG